MSSAAKTGGGFSSDELSRFYMNFRLGHGGNQRRRATAADTGAGQAADPATTPEGRQWCDAARRSVLQWLSTHRVRRVRSVADHILDFVPVPADTGAGAAGAGAGSKRARSPPAQGPGSASSSLAVPGSADEWLQPSFYIHPPYDGTVSLFACMSAAVALTDEELNTFFGRYGMVASRRIPSGPASDTNAQPHSQHFIVTLDADTNCIRCFAELRHADILLLAFHHPARNVFCVADLPTAPTRFELLLASAIHAPRATAAFAHVAAALRVAAGHTTAPLAEEQLQRPSDAGPAAVPEIVVDGLPFWLTREQLQVRLAPFGHVVSLRLSTDDRTGAFNGCALVRMETLRQAVAVAEALNGQQIADGFTATAGLISERLEIVSPADGAVRQAPDASAGRMGLYPLFQQRVWV